MGFGYIVMGVALSICSLLFQDLSWIKFRWDKHYWEAALYFMFALLTFLVGAYFMFEGVEIWRSS